MAQLLSNDVLPAICSPDATKRRSAEQALEAQFTHEPYQVVVWLLDRLSFAEDMTERQMAAVLLGRRLPVVWSRIPPQGQKQTTDVLLQVLQKETSRPVLVGTASALVSLASAQDSAGRATFVQNIIQVAGNLLNATEAAEITREVGCIILSDLADRMREYISALNLDSLQSGLQMIILTSEPSQLQLSAVRCLGHIGMRSGQTSLKLKCISHLARTLLSDGTRTDLKEDILRSCFETLQEEHPPQGDSMEVALLEVGLLRQDADERTQAQAIRVLAAAAKSLPELFGVEARRACVQALCRLCRSVDDSDDSDVLADAAREGISALAEYLVASKEPDSTVLALCWAFAAAVSASSCEVDRSTAFRCLAAALAGTFRAAVKHASHGLQASIKLPPNVSSPHDVLMPFVAASADASAVVRRAAIDALSVLVEQASSLPDLEVWAALADAIRKSLTNVVEDADMIVQTNVIQMVRVIVLEMKTERLDTLLDCMVPATVALAQRAVPLGFENAATCAADWIALEDRLSVVAIIAEVAGAGFGTHAADTVSRLLRPLLFTPAVPLSVKFVALRALGPVLASTGPPSSSGPRALLIPFWKEGLQVANETIQSEEARSHCLGFYAALASIFRGGKDSVVLLQEEAATIVPLGLVVSAALSALSVPGATGEVGSDCEKSWCEGAAAAIVQGGPRTWARTQSHEEARYALFALQTCAVSNGQSFLKVVPQILPVLMPRFTEAASAPIRLATLGLLEDVGKMIGFVMGSGECSAQDSGLLHELVSTILRAVAAAISAEPQSAPVCHEGLSVLTNLKAFCPKEANLVDTIVQGLGAHKHDHEDDSDSDAKDAKRINGHQIAKKGG